MQQTVEQLGVDIEEKEEKKPAANHQVIDEKEEKESAENHQVIDEKNEPLKLSEPTQTEPPLMKKYGVAASIGAIAGGVIAFLM